MVASPIALSLTPPPISVPVPMTTARNSDAVTAADENVAMPQPIPIDATTGGGTGNDNANRPASVITTGTSASTQAAAPITVTTLIDSSSDSSDVIISNEGSAFAALKWRKPLLPSGVGGTGGVSSSSSGTTATATGDQQARETLTLFSSSDEDESAEVSAYSKNQVAGVPTFDRDGARISPNTLARNSGRTVIVNFGGRGSSTATVGETPTPSRELNVATPAVDSGLITPRTQTITPPEVAQTVQVVTTEPAAAATATATSSTTGQQSTTTKNEPPPIVSNLVDSDSDSDECVFVCAKKPPHLRTPEYVELNSESDSDVVFVNEEQLPIPPSVKMETQDTVHALWPTVMSDFMARMDMMETSTAPATATTTTTTAPSTTTTIDNDTLLAASGLRDLRYGARDLMWNSVISKNPFGRSTAAAATATRSNDDGLGTTASTSSGRRRKYPRYLKSYVHENDDTDSDEEDSIPLKRLLPAIKPKRKEKTIDEPSSSSQSSGQDSTDAGTSSSSNSDDNDDNDGCSSSSHEVYKLPSVTRTSGEKNKPAKRKSNKTKRTTAKTKRNNNKNKDNNKRKKKPKSKSKNADVATVVISKAKRSRKSKPTRLPDSSSDNNCSDNDAA